MHTTRIFAGKIRVANFEMHTTRIFAVKSELQILKCPQLGFVVKIRVTNFEIAQLGFPR